MPADALAAQPQLSDILVPSWLSISLHWPLVVPLDWPNWESRMRPDQVAQRHLIFKAAEPQLSAILAPCWHSFGPTLASSGSLNLAHLGD